MTRIVVVLKRGGGGKIKQNKQQKEKGRGRENAHWTENCIFTVRTVMGRCRHDFVVPSPSTRKEREKRELEKKRREFVTFETFFTKTHIHPTIDLIGFLLYIPLQFSHAAPSSTSTSSGDMLAAGGGSGRLRIAAAAFVALPPILKTNTERQGVVQVGEVS